MSLTFRPDPVRLFDWAKVDDAETTVSLRTIPVDATVARYLLDLLRHMPDGGRARQDAAAHLADRLGVA